MSSSTLIAGQESQAQTKGTTAKPQGILLLGAGTVGQALAGFCAHDQDSRFTIQQALVRNAKRSRAGIDDARLTESQADLDFEQCDIVVEALGDIEPARTLILKALEAGKPVVTANKELIAKHGESLLATADHFGVPLRYEAAVGGAVPCIRILRETLRATKVRRIVGVLNGTSHYILSQLLGGKDTFDSAVTKAQAAGYAEADPARDLAGHDAAQKLSILAWTISGELPPSDLIPRIELPALSQATVLAAARIGFAIKPLASLSWDSKGKPELWIAPAAVPQGSALAASRDVEACVLVETEHAGQLFLSSPGAGGNPTASAIFDDLLDISEGRADQDQRGSQARVAAGEADQARDWLIHLGEGSSLGLSAVVKHIERHGGDVHGLQQLGANERIIHASGVKYRQSFSEALKIQGACLLEVI